MLIPVVYCDDIYVTARAARLAKMQSVVLGGLEPTQI